MGQAKVYLQIMAAQKASRPKKSGYMQNLYAETEESAGKDEQQQPGAPHTQTSATATDPGNGPARFTKYL